VGRKKEGGGVEVILLGDCIDSTQISAVGVISNKKALKKSTQQSAFQLPTTDCGCTPFRVRAARRPGRSVDELGHEPGDRAKEGKRGGDGHEVLDLLTTLRILYVLHKDGQASKQDSQNYDDDGCKHGAYLRCGMCESAKPLPHTGITRGRRHGEAALKVAGNKKRPVDNRLLFL